MSAAEPGERPALAFRAMPDDNTTDGLRERLARGGEDALGKLAQDLLENPLVNGAIARAFSAREKAAQAQEVAFGALNLPSAADLERLTRRVRSVAQRLEGIEDGVDRLDARIAGLQGGGLDARLAAIEGRLDAIAGDLSALRGAATKAAAPARAATPKRASTSRPKAAGSKPKPRSKA